MNNIEDLRFFLHLINAAIMVWCIGSGIVIYWASKTRDYKMRAVRFIIIAILFYLPTWYLIQYVLLR